MNPSRLDKNLGNSLLADQLVASQEGLASMKLVTLLSGLITGERPALDTGASIMNDSLVDDFYY
jgi:hypothetical protein